MSGSPATRSPNRLPSMASRRLPSLPRAAVLLLALLPGIANVVSAQAAPPWVSLGPDGGAVIDLAIDPADPSRMYAGVADRGVFRSEDGGATWLPPGDGLSSFFIFSSVEVDPFVPGRIWAGVNFSGVFRSDDRGATWTAFNVGLPALSVLDLALDPAVANTVYVALRQGGVLRSTDAGLTWNSLGIPTGYATLLEIDPRDSRRLYAGTIAQGVYRSPDAGGSWEAFGAGSTGSSQMTAIAINPADSSVVYVGTAGDGLYRSTNSGVEWTRIDTAPVEPHINAIAIDPGNSNTIYVATLSDIFVTRDGGTSWQSVPVRPIHVVTTDVLFQPGGGGRLWAASDAGVFKSADGGQSWAASHAGMRATQTPVVIVARENPGLIFAAGGGAGVFRSSDGGATWSIRDTGLPGGRIASIFRDASGALLAGGTGQSASGGLVPSLSRSADSGDSWSPSSAGFDALVFQGFAADAVNPLILYAATSDRSVFKSTDGGAIWQPARTALPNAVFAILADPTTPGALWAGVIGATGGVYRSVDAAANWTTRSVGLTNRDVLSLAADPSRPGVVYAGTNGGGVFLTADGGSTWSASSAGLLDRRSGRWPSIPATPTRFSLGRAPASFAAPTAARAGRRSTTGCRLRPWSTFWRSILSGGT